MVPQLGRHQRGHRLGGIEVTEAEGSHEARCDDTIGRRLPMNQTRKISISSKIFTIKDLRRIADIFDKQVTLAEKSQHHAAVSYSVTFSDDTALESDSPDLFSEDSLTFPARPVAVQMTFHNYKLARHINFSVRHGDSSYGNCVLVSAPDMQWLGQTFLSVQDAIRAVCPQGVWFRRHKTLLLTAIALGIGTAGIALLNLLGAAIFLKWLNLSGIIVPLRPDSPWRRVVADAAPFLYVLGWLWRWFAGICWGAPWVRAWVLSAWPDIELDFGPPHLHIEKAKRQRLFAVATLVVLPVLVNVIYDVGKVILK